MPLRVALRDDDTNYFTTIEDLTRAFGSVWDTAPVSLAVVPFVAESYLAVLREIEHLGRPATKADRLRLVRELETRGKLPNGRNSAHPVAERLYPLHENRELVEALCRLLAKGRISIMLHGYSHAYYPDGYEFETAADLASKVVEGKRYLEATLSTRVDVFVPPNNSLSASGAQAVVDGHMRGTLIDYSHLPWERPLSARSLANFARMLGFWAMHGKRSRRPRPLDFGTHCEMPCYPLHDHVDLDELLDAVREARSADGAFCIASHYDSLLKQPHLRQTLAEFVTALARDAAEFVPASELFS